MTILNINMNNLLSVLILPLAVAITLSSCSDDDPVGADDPDDVSPGLTVVETAVQLGNHSTLVDLVEEAGLTEALAEEDLTLVAPTNSAFDDLPDGLLESLTSEQIEDILMYHVVDGATGSAEIGERLEVKALNGEWIMFQTVGENINVNNEVTTEFSDINASNGTVHVIDELLLPSDLRVELDQGNIIDIAKNSEGFDILLDAVEEIGLTPTLKFDGLFTVFPPNDEAFAEFGISTIESLSVEELTEILSYHILPISVDSDNFTDQSETFTITDESLFFTIENGDVLINNSASVVLGDVEAANGFIHAIDNVLLPDAFGTAADNIEKRFMLSELNDLMNEYGIDEIAGDPDAELTIFAPNNDAIQAIETELLSMTDEEVTETLLYHVVESVIDSESFEESQTVETANDGEELLVEVSEGIVTINGEAIVELADNFSTNGVIHIIDDVLLPENQGGGTPSE